MLHGEAVSPLTIRGSVYVDVLHIHFTAMSRLFSTLIYKSQMLFHAF